MANNTRYFVLANYTQKAIAGMVQAPTDRAAAVKKICKAAGVKFISLDLCRGVYDLSVSYTHLDVYKRQGLAAGQPDVALAALQGMQKDAEGTDLGLSLIHISRGIRPARSPGGRSCRGREPPIWTAGWH